MASLNDGWLIVMCPTADISYILSYWLMPCYECSEKTNMDRLRNYGRDYTGKLNQNNWIYSLHYVWNHSTHTRAAYWFWNSPFILDAMRITSHTSTHCPLSFLPLVPPLQIRPSSDPSSVYPFMVHCEAAFPFKPSNYYMSQKPFYRKKYGKVKEYRISKNLKSNFTQLKQHIHICSIFTRTHYN